MKRILAIVLSALILAVGAVFFAACAENGDGGETGGNGGDTGNNNGGTQQTVEADVYVPDGAPALALAELMSEEMQFGGKVEYNVVNASTIQAYVTSNDGDPQAELAVLPVNLAAKLLGTGERYQMLGAVTHGNLYILGKTEGSITSENLHEAFEGKKVGCLQLNNFVGYVLRTVLSNADIKFDIRQDKGETNDTKDTAYLYDVTGEEITPAAKFDLMIAAEPAVTRKTSKTSLKVVGDLQALYGTDGYPQAVLVAKSSLIETNPGFIADFIEAVDASADWLKTASAKDIYDAVAEHLGGATPTFSEEDLTADVIGRCAVRYEPAQDIKARVTTFLSELSEAAEQTFTMADAFFYAPVSAVVS